MDGNRAYLLAATILLALSLERSFAFSTDGELVVSLESGLNRLSGRVEVRYKHNPKKYPICADHFGIHSARVVCRVLGFTGEPRIAKRGFFGRSGQDMWLTELRCTGTEEKLEDCPSGTFSANCRSKEEAGVFCLRQGVLTLDPPKQWDVPDPMVCGVDMSHSVVQQPVFIELNQVTEVEEHMLQPKRVPQEVKERIAKPNIIDSTARFPWIAQVRHSLGDDATSMYTCGATIISEFFVLTSARCAARSLAEIGIIRVGDFDIGVVDDFERDYRIKNVATTERGEMKNRDIALIQIRPDENGRGIAFSQFVLPACLPSAYTPYLKSMICTIGGYGRDGFFRENKFLRTGTVPLLDRDICRSAEGSHNYLRKGLFCAGGTTWSSVGCAGDRGSPLICKMNGRSVLMGIDTISGCGTPNKISYYTDVQYHLQWIAEAMRNMTSTQ